MTEQRWFSAAIKKMADARSNPIVGLFGAIAVAFAAGFWFREYISPSGILPGVAIAAPSVEWVSTASAVEGCRLSGREAIQRSGAKVRDNGSSWLYGDGDGFAVTILCLPSRQAAVVSVNAVSKDRASLKRREVSDALSSIARSSDRQTSELSLADVPRFQLRQIQRRLSASDCAASAALALDRAGATQITQADESVFGILRGAYVQIWCTRQTARTSISAVGFDDLVVSGALDSAHTAYLQTELESSFERGSIAEGPTLGVNWLVATHKISSTDCMSRAERAIGGLSALGTSGVHKHSNSISTTLDGVSVMVTCPPVGTFALVSLAGSKGDNSAAIEEQLVSAIRE